MSSSAGNNAVTKVERMDYALIFWCTLLYLLPLRVLCQLLCPPEVTEINSPAKLICKNPDQNTVAFKSPNGTRIAACDANKGCYIQGGSRYNATNINATQSCLKIVSVELWDDGNWTCEDTLTYAKRKCTLLLTATPSCNISSYGDTENLHVGEELTLSVNIRDYYCSRPMDFRLQAGDSVVTVKENLTTDRINTDTFISTFNMSEDHYGLLGLTFICNKVSKDIQCDGVKTLQAKLPSCNISSEQDTNNIVLGDQLSLSVYIGHYYCSSNITYQLQVGNMREKLITNMTENEHIFLSSSFSAKDSHYGSVGLFLICKNVTRSVPCEGVNHVTLKKGTPITSVTPIAQDVGDSCTNLIPIIAGTTAAVAFTAAVIILMCYGVMVHQHKTKIPTFQRECPYADVADNVNSRPKSIRFKDNGAYAEIEVSEVGSTSIKESDERGTAPAHITPDMERDDTTGISSAHISPEVGYASADEYKHDGPPAYSIGLSEKSPNFKPEDVYSNVNKRISKTSVSGDC